MRSKRRKEEGALFLGRKKLIRSPYLPFITQDIGRIVGADKHMREECAALEGLPVDLMQGIDMLKPNALKYPAYLPILRSPEQPCQNHSGITILRHQRCCVHGKDRRRRTASGRIPIDKAERLNTVSHKTGIKFLPEIPRAVKKDGICAKV